MTNGMDTGGIHRVIERQRAEWFAERARDRDADLIGRAPEPERHGPRRAGGFAMLIAIVLALLAARATTAVGPVDPSTRRPEPPPGASCWAATRSSTMWLTARYFGLVTPGTGAGVTDEDLTPAPFVAVRRVLC